MKVAILFLSLLAFQVVVQTRAAMHEYSTFKVNEQRNHFTELEGYVSDLGDPENPSVQEVGRITQLVKTANRNFRNSVRQPVPSNAPSVCETKSDRSIFVFGRCPDECLPFSTARFNACGSLIQFGCELVPCDGGMFTCRLREELTSDITVCPGDRVIFEDVELSSFQNVSFNIDLQAPPVRTDLYLLSDATGSMRRAIDTVQNKFTDLINVFGERENVAFGAGFYRDETELDNGFENSQQITLNRGAVRRAVDALIAEGGGDGDEANLIALYKVATDDSIGWRDGSRRILVYFGDWPGHEPTCAGTKKITRREVIDALKAKSITVIGVSFPPPGIDAAPRESFGSCHSRRAAGPGQASEIISETNGELVSRNDQARLVEAIETAVGSLSRTYAVDESDCVARIESVHTPSLPLTLESSESTTVTNMISLRDRVCATSGSFECRYKYTESGADLEDLEMEFVNIRGCPDY